MILGKARNNMMRRDCMFNKDKSSDLPMLDGEPPLGLPPHEVNSHENHREKGCPKCQLFGCAKAFQEESECDIFGKPTTARLARIAKMEKYKNKVDTYRKEKKQDALIYGVTAAMTHYNATDFMSNAEYSALVESLVDEEDDVEAEFSMCKSQMIIRDPGRPSHRHADGSPARHHPAKQSYRTDGYEPFHPATSITHTCTNRRPRGPSPTDRHFLSELLTYQEDNTPPSATDTQPSTTDSPLKNLPYDDNTTPLATLLPSPYLASEPCTTIPQTQPPPPRGG